VVVLAAALRFAIMRLYVVSGRIWTVLVVGGLVGLVSLSKLLSVFVRSAYDVGVVLEVVGPGWVWLGPLRC